MILWLLVILVLAALGTPLFVVISGVALFGFASVGRPPADVAGEISKLIQMDTLITIPLLTFAGYMLAESGAPRRLVAVSRAMFSWMPGGMAVVTLVTCAFFTTFTGASGITIVALGGLLLPVLLKQGYPREFSLGLVTTSGSRGLVFPPSVPVIIYGYIASVDITRLYVAGLVPGMIDVAVIAVLSIWVGVKAKIPVAPFDGKAAGRALLRALPEVLLPVWLVALLATGVLKLPEAAAMTALYVLLIEVLVYRDIHPLDDLPRITRESMVLCGAILIILGASLGLTNFLVDRQVPQKIVALIATAIDSKWIFLFALNGFLLVVGCLLDIFSAIVIVVPLLLPLAGQFGVNPFHLALIFLLNLELGYNTPPVGMNLFISSFRFRQPIVRLYRAAIPFVLMNLIALAIVTYIPPISTFTLPQSMRLSPAPASTSPSATPGKAAPSKPTAPAKADGLCLGNNPADPDCKEDIDIDIEAELRDIDGEDNKDKKADKDKAGAPAKKVGDQKDKSADEGAENEGAAPAQPSR